MSDSMINMKISRKCGGELQHSIKCRCLEPFSTEDYINDMEDIITRTRIGKTCTRIPMERKMVSKTSREDYRPERPVCKCHKCGSTSHLANTCTKKTNINEVTEVHNHLPNYSEDFHNLINIQDARMCKTKRDRGKGYTSGASCIISILINDIEARVKLDTGAFCTCLGKDHLQAILPGWKNHLLQIEGLQFISASNNMYPLGILDTNLVFPHPAGSLVEAQINPSLSPKMRHDLIDVLYTYRNAFASDNEPLGAIKRHEVYITLHIERPYPSLLRRPAFPGSARAREALEKHSQKLIQPCVLRKVGHNE
ncbi:hypothetical protein O181_001852 [Austropuccinia psidii MF-1]|uniref:Uncharacterized protein n=1 Tax=Austropuccinia psidii MF-1 TaxID=1389203 RepID=A0A9Q3BBN5_9BASI|nr:hypothetical protein [Austropuccinia psidii MF-1]